MKKTTQSSPDNEKPPMNRPLRVELLTPMLTGTKRSFVPIRRSFIQAPPGTEGSRKASLAHLSRDSYVLDAYLLLHALASSGEPYLVSYPAATWVQLVRLDETATFAAAKSRWSKVITKLVSLRLLERDRTGNQMGYRLLDESGNGEQYRRPKQLQDGNWFRLPYAYWWQDFDAELSHPEKLMLLLALDQKETFTLPFNQVAKWYGISESTARRGFRGLERRGLLSKTSSYTPSPRSPSGWAEELRYTLQEPFTRGAVDEAQKITRSRVPSAEAGRS